VLVTNHHSQRGKKQIVVSCQLSVGSCQWAVVSGQWSVGSGCRCGATHGVGPPIVADRWCHQTPIGRGGTRGGSLSWLGRGHLSGATQLSRDHPRPVGRENGMPVRGHPWRIWWRSGGATQRQSVNKTDGGDFRRGSDGGPAAQPGTAVPTAIRGTDDVHNQWGHPMPVGEQKRSRRFPPRFGMRPGRPTEHCPVHCNTGTASAKRGQPVGPPSADRWCHPTPIGRRGTRGGSLSWLGRGLLDGATQLWRDHPRPVGRENRMPVRGHPWRIWWRCSGATQRRRGHPTPVGERNRQGRFAPRLGRRRRGHTRGHFPARLATG
jgi:hypothetical protein